MSSIGESLKTMFARLENIKLGQNWEDDATTINDVEKTLRRFNIALRESRGEFRPMGDVMDDIAKKWGNLSEVEQSAIAVSIAGEMYA